MVGGGECLLRREAFRAAAIAGSKVTKWVKSGKAQSEQILSALPPMADSDADVLEGPSRARSDREQPQQTMCAERPIRSPRRRVRAKAEEHPTRAPSRSSD